MSVIDRYGSVGRLQYIYVMTKTEREVDAAGKDTVLRNRTADRALYIQVR